MTMARRCHLGHIATTGDSMELHGVTGKPYKHPQVRRTVPTFSRPSIDLDGGTRVQRAWEDVSVLKLKKNDAVVGFGTISEVQQFLDRPERESFSAPLDPAIPNWRVRLYNVMGDFRD